LDLDERVNIERLIAVDAMGGGRSSAIIRRMSVKANRHHRKRSATDQKSPLWWQ